MATFFAANFGGAIVHPEEQASNLHIPFADSDAPPVQIHRDELIAKGAVKLGSAELSALLSGAMVSGYVPDGGFFKWRANADGTADGVLQNPNGQCSLVGKWRVSEKDQLCWHGQVTCSFNFNRPGGGCSDWYRLGANYYTVQFGNALLREVRR
jgi:hypothetical protein